MTTKIFKTPDGATACNRCIADNAENWTDIDAVPTITNPTLKGIECSLCGDLFSGRRWFSPGSNLLIMALLLSIVATLTVFFPVGAFVVVGASAIALMMLAGSATRARCNGRDQT